MAPTKLSDHREAKIQTLEEAAELFNSIAASEIKIARAAAMTEARIATIKEQHIAKAAMIDPDLDAKREALAAYIEAHTEQFQQPRHVNTDFGKFGLQDAGKLVYPDKAVEFVVYQGMANCFVTSHKPVAKGIEAALVAGTRIPGVLRKSGDIAHYTVKKALLDEAKEI